MLETQEYLWAYGLKDLCENHKIDVTHHPSLPLTIFSYDAYEARKAGLEFHPITRECRSLCLETNTWALVSKAFSRFYNFGEDKSLNFHWSNFRLEEKVDGSIISLFYYKDEWRIRTNSSFGQGQITQEFPWTWQSLFFSILPLNNIYLNCSTELTYVFELTSPYNIVVHPHKEPKLTLLSVFCNSDGFELGHSWLDYIAEKLGVNRPKKYDFTNIDDAIKWIHQQPGITHEGMVGIDVYQNRFKIKSEGYLRLHRLKNNGNIILYRHLIPVIMQMPQEKEEVCLTMPMLREKWEKTETEISELFKNADEIYNLYSDYNKKQFALAIQGESKLMKGILFTCRTKNILPSSAQNDFLDLIIDHFENKRR